MASATISSQSFTSGTVTVYPASNWPAYRLPPTGAPVGSSTTSAAVSGGSVTFSGLASDTRYYAYQLDGSTHRYVAFSTYEDVPPAQRVTTETGLDVPRTLFSRAGTLAHGDAIASRVLAPSQSAALLVANGAAYTAVFYFNPAEYAVDGKTTQISVAGILIQPASTQTAAISIGLRPVTAISAGGNPTLGSLTTSADLMPAGSVAGNYPGRSSWVTAPASGRFALTLEVATTTVVGAVFAQASLDVRHS